MHRGNLALFLALALAVAAVPATQGAPPADEPSTHLVQRGDTLYAIALRHGVTLQALIQANGIRNPNLLFPGQRLVIPRPPAPPSGAPAATYRVQPGDTLYGLASRLGVTPAQLAGLNGLSPTSFLYVGQLLRLPESAPPSPPPAPAAPAGQHLVSPGETVYGIAVRYGVSPAALVQLNRLTNPNLLFVGQRLLIPAAGGSPEAQVEPSPPSPPTPTPAPSPTATPNPFPPPLQPSGEVRGLWVTRWDYRSPDDVRRILDRALEGGFNTVYFQVRGRADAFYRSSLEPWAAELSGQLGGDPGWDPLEVAVSEAHRRGISLQAYVNVFPAWSGSAPPGPGHPYARQPDWVVVDRSGRAQGLGSHYVFFNPAHPQVQRHLTEVILEIATRYAVDGVHLDYIRYPDRQYSFDAVTSQRFAAEGGGLSREDWQRRELGAFVARLRGRLQEVRPGLPLTAAVISIYEDRWGWRSRSARDDYYQDWYAWASGGTVDQVLPMIYWNRADPPRFDWILDEIVRNVPADRVVVGIYGDYASFGEIEGQIAYARSRGVRGVAVFSYALLERRGYWDELAAGPFR